MVRRDPQKDGRAPPGGPPDSYKLQGLFLLITSDIACDAMKIRRDATYAVLTGDVVGSSKLEPRARRKLPGLLRRTGTALRKRFPDVVPLDLDVFRGDGWQMVVERPEESLAIALAFRAHCRSAPELPDVDSRVAIGIGRIAFLPGHRVSEGDGEAFQRSGQALEAMDRRVQLDARFPDDTAVGELRALLWLIDRHVQDWTARQSQALVGALSGWTQERIATGWKPSPISQQAVAQHLDRAGWYAIEAGIEAFRERVAAGR